jgi:tRNA (uracil-5-)-methyltransferase TRM9
MKPETADQLLSLNRQFYQTFAAHFSATRRRIQPGVKQVLDSIPNEARVLDLGCGNGELALELTRREHKGSYVGLDFSPDLIKIAQERLSPSLEASFIPVDFSTPDWDKVLPMMTFDTILAFAVLHHLPGADLHRQVLRKIRLHLAQDGKFIHSNWQFLKSERLRGRVQPWEEIGLSTEQVNPGDYLLDWRHGGYGLRYVHFFSLHELHALALETGFRVAKTFTSDGEEGNLGLYQIWEPI